MRNVFIRERTVPENCLKPDGMFKSSQDSNVKHQYDFAGDLKDRITAVKKMGEIVYLFDFLKHFPVEGSLDMQVAFGGITSAGAMEVWGENAYYQFMEIWAEVDRLLEDLLKIKLEELSFSISLVQTVTLKE
jgi:hypothetical protein